MSEQAFKFTFIDLFAGIGGFHQALEAEGGRCVLAVERDPECQKVYQELFPETDIVGDIRSLTYIDQEADKGRHLSGETDRTGNRSINELVPDHDVLCAGFPCQPFSKSGHQEGTEDRTRGTLFHDILQIIRAKAPSFVLLENVRNLTGPRHRDTWSTIIESLREAGYTVDSDPLILSPHRFSPSLNGAPQVRDRVFILAYRNDLESGSGLPKVDPSNGFDPDTWQIAKYLDFNKDIEDLQNYRLSKEELSWLEAWQDFIQGIDSESLPGFPIWVDDFEEEPIIPKDTPAWKENFLKKNSDLYVTNRKFIDKWRKKTWGDTGTIHDFPASRRKFEWQARKAQPSRKDRDLYKLVLQFRPSGIRVKPPTYLPALVAITQTSIIGSLKRRITPREAARLQGMDADRFAAAIKAAGVSDATAYKQLGNAVNVGMVRLAAQALFAGRSPWVLKE